MNKVTRYSPVLTYPVAPRRSGWKKSALIFGCGVFFSPFLIYFLGVLIMLPYLSLTKHLTPGQVLQQLHEQDHMQATAPPNTNSQAIHRAKQKKSQTRAHKEMIIPGCYLAQSK